MCDSLAAELGQLDASNYALNVWCTEFGPNNKLHAAYALSSRSTSFLWHTATLGFTVPVDRGIVKPIKGGPMGAFMRKRVLRAEAEAIVGADGRLTRLAVTIGHSDPMQKMIRRVRIQVGAGGVPVPIEEDDEDEDAHDVETGSTVYRLEFKDAAPSDRAKQFKKEIQQLAGDQR